MKRVTAFAPATVANVAVGFDLLGFPMTAVGDEVTLTRIAEKKIEIANIHGAPELPTDPEKNTATIGLLSFLSDTGLDHGFRVELKKGIPLSSGMGGSAASAVAAIFAANVFLDNPLSRERLLHYALIGEKLASGSAHADNASPCLFGGLTLTRSADPVDVVTIPVPATIRCVLVHPHLRLDTRTARGVLKTEVSLKDMTRQSANLAGFIAACYRGDIPLLRRTLVDLVIEPQRASLIKGFTAVKAAALAAGAIGGSISGSGPSVFAWTDSASTAIDVELAMVRAFEAAGVAAESWIAPIEATGARIVFEE